MTERIRTILEELSRTAVDWRTTVYDVRLVEEQGRLILEGEVFDPALHDRVVQTLAAALPGMEIVDQLGVLINGPDYSWAIVSRPILNLRRQPDHSAELLTQATFGEPVEVLRRQGEWSFVRVSDGYLGWVHALGLLSVSQEHACSYRADASHLVGQGIVPCYDETGRQVSLLPFGVPVQVERVVAGTAYLRTPEGVYWRVAEDALVKVEERPRPNQEGDRAAVQHAGTLCRGSLSLGWIDPLRLRLFRSGADSAPLSGHERAP
ncbi:MAG: hypothetical protein KatS3mg057_2421 [Herpetosiphonaceae bacterium]|nr:MAG: hypothetical protein KatS3mg057_2421 [Herpetosiphonaceae bacterium]